MSSAFLNLALAIIPVRQYSEQRSQIPDACLSHTSRYKLRSSQAKPATQMSRQCGPSLLYATWPLIAWKGKEYV